MAASKSTTTTTAAAASATITTTAAAASASPADLTAHDRSEHGPHSPQHPADFPPTTPPPTNCDAAYPDFCIPRPPDLNCADVGRHNFTVLPPDPHRFDADHDGIGCES